MDGSGATSGDQHRQAAGRSGASRGSRESPGELGAIPSRGRFEHTFAALDLGTNNCRLLVARPEGAGFRVVDAFSRIVRLGEGLSTSGSLSDEAMTRTVEALHICADKIRRRGVTRGRMIATEACRLAANGDQFIARVRDEVGLDLDIISNEEEAQLAVAGCATLLDRRCDRALVFDIGGGSTELIWLDLTPPRRRRARSWRPRILAWASLPCGVVTLTEAFPDGATHGVGYAAMVEHVARQIAPFRARCLNRDPAATTRSVHLLGTSGTVTTIAGISLNLPRYQRHRVDGLWLTSTRVDEVVGSVTRMSYEGRVAQPCIGHDRADLVIAGCAILDAIRVHWPADRLRVADRGLREGLLHAMMVGADREAADKRRSNKTGAGRGHPVRGRGRNHRRTRPAPTPMDGGNRAE